MNSEIIKDLKGENNNAFGLLYKKYFGMVKAFIVKNSGQTNDAEDIFQETMLVLVKKMRKDDFQLTASIKTYIMAISKNLWYKQLRITNHKVNLMGQNSNLSIFVDDIDEAIEQEKTYWDRLQNYINRISKHCRDLIRKMFFKGEAIEQIQREYGYTTRHNAQNQKHKCIEQIRRIKEQEEKNRLN